MSHKNNTPNFYPYFAIHQETFKTFPLLHSTKTVQEDGCLKNFSIL